MRPTGAAVEGRPAQLVTVRWFLWLPEADLATAALKSYGVECFLADQYYLLSFPLDALALDGVKLRVRDSDLLSAQDVIQWLDRGEQVRCPNCGSPRFTLSKRFTWVFLGLLICGSVFIPCGIFVLLICMVAGIRLGRLALRRRCKDCGWSWLDRGTRGSELSDEEESGDIFPNAVEGEKNGFD